jgi:hypothetical protein
MVCVCLCVCVCVGINQGSTDRDARQRNPVALCCSHSPTEPALHNDALHNDALHNDALSCATAPYRRRCTILRKCKSGLLEFGIARFVATRA